VIGRGGSGRSFPAAPVLLALALAGAVAGCGHLVGGGHPSGLADWDHRLRTLLRSGTPGRALELVSRENSEAGDELLRLQHEGLVAHYAGRWEQSSDAFERAYRLTEDRYTKSVSKAVLSMLASDRVLDYYPPPPERLLLHYYAALDYLRTGEPDEAAVEARRLGRLLGKALDGDYFDTPPEVGAPLSRFAGAVFEAAGQHNDAAVAYRRARAFAGDGEEAAAAALDVTGAAPIPGLPAPGPPDGASSGGEGGEAPGTGPDDLPRGGPPPASGTGEVVVVVERGFVAHKVERDVILFLRPDEVETLRRVGRRASHDDEEADREAALEIAEEVLGREIGERADDDDLPGARGGTGPRPARPGAGPRPRPGTGDRSRSVDAGRSGVRTAGGADPVLVRIAWPVYRESTPVRGVSRLVVGTDTASSAPASRVDVSRAVKAAYADRRALDLAKTLVRAATKTALAEGVEEAVSEEDETLGEIAGWTARIAGAVLERADTRCWHLLPARLELHRLRLPAGTHRIEALLPGRGGDERRELGPVDVQPGEVEVVSLRDWS
jgi:tetratricopeptide (TPR) repeat protein